ncbi:MAG: YlmC/YmxH family sporulation protein [Clostridia bacterium]|nr:YlmC/YmxH family sporulation protein [Clostridia bacterium]
MEISLTELKEKEVVNVYDGKRLGRILDLVFDSETGIVSGIVVPGEKKLFKRNDGLFVPLEKIKRIGDDVILIGLQFQVGFQNVGLGNKKIKKNLYAGNYYSGQNLNFNNGQGQSKKVSYVRYRRVK